MQQRRRRRIRWWTALAAAIVVVGAMLSVTHAATAEEEPDALALAARIPNDQGPAPECAGSKGGHVHNVPDKCHADMGGPANGDFIDIRQVRPAGRGGQAGRQASTGTFVSVCGTNAEGHHNSDNFIVAPGVTNGAHHTHDYVGNVSADGNSTNESLAAAGTTCARERPVHLLLAGAAPHRQAGLGSERRRRRQGRQRRGHPEARVGAAGVRRQQPGEGLRDAAVPAGHHR